MSRIIELDGLRGVAAVMVVFSHITGALAFSERGGIDLLDELFPKFVRDGELAVSLFFVLSGFVLSRSVPRYFSGFGSFFLKNINFGLKRVFRIYPAHITVCALCLLASWLLSLSGHHRSDDWGDWIEAFWTTPPGFTEALQSVLLVGPNINTRALNPVIWTLAIEVKVSLLLPLLLWINRSIGLNISFFATILFGLIIVIIGKSGTFVYVFHFMLGIQLFLWRSSRGVCGGNDKITPVAALVIYVLYCSNQERFLDVWGELVRGIVGAGLCVIAMEVSVVRKALRTAVAQYLGQVSYALYLIHLPILIVLTILVDRDSLTVDVIIVLSYISITLIFAHVLMKSVELPGMIFGQRVVNKANINRE